MAGGLAAATGLPVVAVRLAFVVLSAARGAGLAAYGVFWVFLPQADGETLRIDRRGQGLLLGLLLLLGAGLATLVPLGVLRGQGPRRRCCPSSPASRSSGSRPTSRSGSAGGPPPSAARAPWSASASGHCC